MSNKQDHPNVLLLRAAALGLLIALALAWCMVLLKVEVAAVANLFKDFDRLLQAHIDYLLMSALILGFYGARVPLPWHVRWAMVIGAFTNPGLFLLQSIYPAVDTATAAQDFPVYGVFTGVSLVLTTYGFGAGAVCLFRGTLGKD